VTPVRLVSSMNYFVDQSGEHTYTKALFCLQIVCLSLSLSLSLLERENLLVFLITLSQYDQMVDMYRRHLVFD